MLAAAEALDRYRLLGGGVTAGAGGSRGTGQVQARPPGWWHPDDGFRASPLSPCALIRSGFKGARGAIAAAKVAAPSAALRVIDAAVQVRGVWGKK